MPKNPNILDQVVLLDGGSVKTQGGTAIISVAADGTPTVTGAEPGADSITTAMLQDEAVTMQKIETNNVSGVIGFDSGGAPTIIDSFVANAVLKDNGTGATPSFGFLNALNFEIPGEAGTKNVMKLACFTYDFDVDGGTIGTITPAATVEIPSGAVVVPHLCFYRVETTCTSAADTATIAIILPTDGTIIPAVAINDAANPWDQGGHVPTSVSSSLIPVTTAARNVQVQIAVQNLTGGKFSFAIPYIEIG